MHMVDIGLAGTKQKKKFQTEHQEFSWTDKYSLRGKVEIPFTELFICSEITLS